MTPPQPRPRLTRRQTIAVRIVAATFVAAALIGGAAVGIAVNKSKASADTTPAPVSDCVVLCDGGSGAVGTPGGPGITVGGSGGSGGSVTGSGGLGAEPGN